MPGMGRESEVRENDNPPVGTLLAHLFFFTPRTPFVSTRQLLPHLTSG